MKVLDPFSGYRLASGHPIFHLALFTGSFIAESYMVGDAHESADECFNLLRWTHFFIFSLSLFSAYANLDSEIPFAEENEKANQETVAVETMQRRHRDSMWKLTNRACETIAVFCYQIAIFFV